ncbi:MAG: transporter substrate-binding domain-containing protein [Deltaproteobacteria bacterium]|nr:transporter substrate-binding domain-containing protein [Deltaproteobacteria bacterium]
MKKLIKLILSAVILCLSFSPSLFGEVTVRLTSGEFEPFMSGKLKQYGILSHIAVEAGNKVGMKIEYGFFPWKRSIILAKIGDWDGSIGWGYSSEREKFFFYTEPIYKETVVFFHLKDIKFDWKTEEDLQDITIGVTRGYLDEEQFRQMKENGKRINYDVTSSDFLNLKKLMAGRFKIFPCNKNVALKLIKENFSAVIAEKITYHPKPFRITPLHVLFSKKVNKNDKNAALFNEGLKKLKESGRYDQMWEDFRQGKYNAE